MDEQGELFNAKINKLTVSELSVSQGDYTAKFTPEDWICKEDYNHPDRTRKRGDLSPPEPGGEYGAATREASLQYSTLPALAITSRSELPVLNSPPELGGVARAARRGGVKESHYQYSCFYESPQSFAQNSRLVGTPLRLGVTG